MRHQTSILIDCVKAHDTSNITVVLLLNRAKGCNDVFFDHVSLHVEINSNLSPSIARNYRQCCKHNCDNHFTNGRQHSRTDIIGEEYLSVRCFDLLSCLKLELVWLAFVIELKLNLSRTYSGSLLGIRVC